MQAILGPFDMLYQLPLGKALQMRMAHLHTCKRHPECGGPVHRAQRNRAGASVAEFDNSLLAGHRIRQRPKSATYEILEYRAKSLSRIPIDQATGDAGNDVQASPRSSSMSTRVDRLAMGVDINTPRGFPDLVKLRWSIHAFGPKLD